MKIYKYDDVVHLRCVADLPRGVMYIMQGKWPMGDEPFYFVEIAHVRCMGGFFDKNDAVEYIKHLTKGTDEW